MLIGGVDVVLGQLAGGGQRAVFLDVAGGQARDGRLVVGAVDGDDDLAGGAVSGRDRELLGQRVLGAELLDGLGVVVELEGPVAVGVDGEGAVLAPEVGLGLEHGLAGVRVGDIELAAGGQFLVFRDRALVVTRLARSDDGAVAGAIDRDGDGLRGLAAMAVVDGHGDGVGHMLAVLERLDVRIGVVELVGPLAILVNGERTVLALAVVVDGPGVRVVGVDVVLGQLAGHVLVAAFLDLAGRGAGDGRGIVGAGDGDGDDLRGGAALAVVDGHGDGVGDLLAFGRGLDLSALVVQHIGPLAVLVDGEGAVLACRRH